MYKILYSGGVLDRELIFESDLNSVRHFYLSRFLAYLRIIEF